MNLNYRHSLATMNKELAKHDMRFTTIAESSNKNSGGITYILKERNSSTDKLTQTCGYYYSATDATDFINKLNKAA